MYFFGFYRTKGAHPCMQFIRNPNNDQAPAIARALVPKEITQNSIFDIILHVSWAKFCSAWGKQNHFTELHLQWSIYHFLSFCRSPNFFSSSIFRRVLGTNFYNNRDHNTDMMEENSREYLFSVQTIHSKCTLLTFLDSFYYINGCFLNQKCP